MRLLFQDQSLDRADRIQLVIAYILQLIIIATFFLAIYGHKWFTAFLTFGILILTFLPSIIHRNYKILLPMEIHFITIVFIFTALFLGELHAYYTRLWWWDVVLHISSGVLLGIVGFLLVYVLNQDDKIHVKMKSGFVSVFAFAFAVAIGAAWEIFEFSMDSFFGLNLQKSGLVDTMWDLIVDVIGALFISIMGYWYLKRKDSFIFNRLVHRFVRRNPQLFSK